MSGARAIGAAIGGYEICLPVRILVGAFVYARTICGAGPDALVDVQTRRGR